MSCPILVGTLFAMAKVSWKEAWTNSMEKEVGSVVLAVHVIVIVPALLTPEGVLMVKAAT